MRQDSRTRCDYLFVLHRILEEGRVKPGGADRIVDFVLGRGAAVGLLENPLYGKGPVVLSLLEGKGRRELARVRLPLKGPARWLAETVAVPNLANTNLRGDFTLICADPLNFASAAPLLRPGRQGIFLVVDYSPRRFAQPLLDRIYRHLFRRAVLRADRVWAASEAAAQVCRGLAPDPGKVAWLPNSPFYDEVPRVPAGERDPRELVLAAHFSQSTGLKMIARALELLPEARLTLIGPGNPDLGIFRDGRVRSLGTLERPEALAEIARLGIGLAFYGGNPELDRFRDSLKIREYAAAGLPTVCDPITATAREGAGRGACFLASTPEELARAAGELMGDRELYLRASDSALAWAREMDKAVILRRLLDLE